MQVIELFKDVPLYDEVAPAFVIICEQGYRRKIHDSTACQDVTPPFLFRCGNYDGIWDILKQKNNADRYQPSPLTKVSFLEV